MELSRRLDDLANSVEIRVVGGHTMWSDFRPLLANLNQRVATYVGPVTSEQVRRELSEADLLIQPSAYEPFGLTAAEALAMGVPVVASDETGAIEEVSDSCSWPYPVGDVDACEMNVRKALAEISSGAVDETQLIARSEAERLFSPDTVAAAISGVLSAAQERG